MTIFCRPVLDCSIYDKGPNHFQTVIMFQFAMPTPESAAYAAAAYGSAPGGGLPYPTQPGFGVGSCFWNLTHTCSHPHSSMHPPSPIQPHPPTCPSSPHLLLHLHSVILSFTRYDHRHPFTETFSIHTMLDELYEKSIMCERIRKGSLLLPSVCLPLQLCNFLVCCGYFMCMLKCCHESKHLLCFV